MADVASQLLNDDTTPVPYSLYTYEVTSPVTARGGYTRIDVGTGTTGIPMDVDNPVHVRTQRADSPILEQGSSISLAATSSDTIDFAAIGAGSTGKALKFTVSSTGAGKWVLSTRDGAVIVDKATLITDKFETREFRIEDKESFTIAHSGGDENFRVTVTNLDTQATDFYASCEWDEE